MQLLSKVVRVVAALTLVVPTSQSLATMLSSTRNAIPRDAFKLAEGAPAVAPLSHVRFCIDHPDDCRAQRMLFRPFKLTAERLAQAQRVNATVNREITPRYKAQYAGWAISPKTGDCNDFAVTKRHELLKRGWPSQVLSLAVVRTSWGEGHLVLIIRSKNGDVVLDNLNKTVRNARDLNYDWIKVQSTSNPRYWAEIRV